MKKKIPTFRSDRAASVFVDKADLSQYGLSGAQLIRFETKPKDKSINLRLPGDLYEAVRLRAPSAGPSYQHFIRRWNALLMPPNRTVFHGQDTGVAVQG